VKALLLPTRGRDPFLQRLAPALEAEGVELDDLDSPSGATLIGKRLRGFRILHMQGMPLSNQAALRRLVRWLGVLGIRLVWNLETSLPRSARAEQVENLRLAFGAARVRIVSSADVRERLQTDFGLSGTTFIIPPTEPLGRIAEAFRTAYETSLERPMPTQDRARPPRA
jgi:hypothetical protein